ncbi:MAG TPA: hypothetical protein VKM72_07770 [Thermoanaerobaculia bacterium]|nr:hypothetical protein [Thermoanaerobaculia bacterium]
MRFRAFISCRFPVHDDVRAIANMLEGEFEAYISEEPKIGVLAYALKDKIAESDCLVVIALDSDGDSAFVQGEIAMAHTLGKPVVAICREGVEIGGILPQLCTWATFKDLRDCSVQIPRLKEEIIGKLSSAFLIPGGPQALLASASKLGILGVYPSRAAAFLEFFRFWEQGHEISIVASTLEGFRKGLGIDPRELLGKKLQASADTKIRLLLTHPEFISYREKQEGAENGVIKSELKRCRQELVKIRKSHRARERLTWRFFKGAPTCFMIATGDFMLLNPYLYMQPGIFNFSLLLRNTGSDIDIYRRYKKYHFEDAWAHPTLSAEDRLVKISK